IGFTKTWSRELGPKGVHVAHVIVDGAIEGDFIRGVVPDFEDRLARDEILKPADIASNYVALWKQPRSAWTHELDLRPWTESW
ncbi:MAG: short-chain dehydrogenase, partial [Parvularculaceae bacterium]